MARECIVCGSAASRAIFHEHDVAILRCSGCGHVYSSHEAPQDYDGYFGAEALSGAQFYWEGAHEAIYSDFCKRFMEGRSGAILDVGCGLGHFVKKAASYKGWKAYGCEISAPAAEYAKKKLGLREIFCGTLEAAGYKKKSFDIVTLWDVIEHIPDPGPLLGEIRAILKDDGMIFMHTPNVSMQLPKARLKKLIRGMRPGSHYLEARDHVNIYSVKSISRVLEAHGFGEVRFAHLRPIQSVSGSSSRPLAAIKNAFFAATRITAAATLGRVNFDNLFVTARKGRKN